MPDSRTLSPHQHEDNAPRRVRSPSPKEIQASRKPTPPSCKASWGVRGSQVPDLRDAPSKQPRREGGVLPFHRLGNEGLPGVPSRAALAPAKVRRPPSLRCLVARWLEMVDVHMLCFHIRSQFLKRAEWRKKNMWARHLQGRQWKVSSTSRGVTRPQQPLLPSQSPATRSSPNSTGPVVRDLGSKPDHRITWISASSHVN